MANWGKLNSTSSVVNLQIYQRSGATTTASYAIINGQQGLPTVGPTASLPALWVSSIIVTVASVIMIAVLLGRRKRGSPV
jgi:hypothetical protein